MQTDRMKRRELLAWLTGAAASPLAARAQQPALPVIGFINAASADGYRPMLVAFHKGLEESGYVEGRNVAIEYRWAEGRSERLPAMAADLVRRRVAVIAATSTPAALAAKAATTTIPIVFEMGADPIQLGLVPSLARPGGNVTGVTQINVEVAPKRLQYLHELLPAARGIALLVNPADPGISDATTAELVAAARTMGLELHLLDASSDSEVETAFSQLTRLGAGGLVIGGGAFFASRSQRLGMLAARHAMPAVFQYREFVTAGGLMSYGSDIADAYRLAGRYAGRVLRGDNPAELPVQQATKVEFYINLKSARTLGLEVPAALLARADEVVE
ncbi:MAG TPA: ABC transporter substrate-binding protein [Xanthobacteraceae bacterium]|jgi:putative ABC transport system substrate-binding protein